MKAHYDPLVPPDPKEWLSTEERARIDAVLQYHQQAKIQLDSESLHAAMHVTVENQVALGAETLVAAALDRLMREGLDRHEAIHAIASVLAEHIWEVLQGQADPNQDSNVSYAADVQSLTAKKWRRKYGVR